MRSQSLLILLLLLLGSDSSIRREDGNDHDDSQGDDDEDDDGSQIWESMCLHVLERLEMTERSLLPSLFHSPVALSSGEQRPTCTPLVSSCWSPFSKPKASLPGRQAAAGQL
jgi:hypothetical protein